VGLNFHKKTSVPSKSIIFDLDGTLIDSQESILGAIEYALDSLGIEAKIPVSRDLIGPPLIETISKITGLSDQSKINELAKKFKEHYDEIGYKDAIVYPGMNELIKSLIESGYVLYVATNKRLKPTLKIIKYLSWGPFFNSVYSIDLNGDGAVFKNKAEMIHALLSEQSIDISSAVYVGDRIEDYEAATANNIPCILVDWGYGENKSNVDKILIRASCAVQLQKILRGPL